MKRRSTATNTTTPPFLEGCRKKTKSVPKLSLCHELLSSSYTNQSSVRILLNCTTSESDPEFAVQSILSLQTFFAVRLFGDGVPDFDLRPVFDDFLACLLDIASSPLCKFHRVRMAVLEAIMVFVKLTKRGAFNFALYQT
ncbi:Prothrombin [Bienertia sinuspersici]